MTAYSTKHAGPKIWPGLIARRGILAATATACLARRSAASLPMPFSGRLGFRMIRLGSEIGTHSVTFSREGDSLTVDVVVDAVVRLLSIPLIRYTHRAQEVWRNVRLVALNGDTDKNGEREWMRAQRNDAGLVVTGSQTKRYVAPTAAIPTSYWNKQMLDGPMISLEDGVLLAPKVTNLGSEQIRLASGTAISATHYNLSGAFNVDLWYDATNTWAGMAMTVRDGTQVRYERL